MDAPTGSIDDFDFLHGTWHVVNRRLQQRWVGSDDWDVFDGSSQCVPRLGGGANIDQIDVPSRSFSGLTIRVFDRSASLWSIWWVNSNRGVLEPPVLGGFHGNVGTFVGEDTDDGVPVTVRFRWDALGPDSARWEQAFCRDGHTWETNWIMDFTRS